MKVEVDLPDDVAPFFELEAKQRQMTLGELIVAKALGGQQHMAKGDWETAPRETGPAEE